jgi:hypothetical protein
MRPFRLFLPLLILLLLVPASAQARTSFFVDADRPHDNADCLTQATACKTINGALGKSRLAGFPGGDDIRIADGKYDERVFLTDQDAGDLIEGGGMPGPYNAGTIIHHEDNSIMSGAVILRDDAAGITIRGLEIDTTDEGAPSPDPFGILVDGPGAKLQYVRVDMPEPGSQQGAIELGDDAGYPLLDHVFVRADGTGDGVRSFSSNASIVDSTIEGGSGAGNALELQGDATVRRSHLTRPVNGSVVRVEDEGYDTTDYRLTVDSSLITGGDNGVFLQADDAEERVEARLRHVTIDAAQAGVANVGTVDAVQVTESGGGAAVLNVSNSLLVEDVLETGAVAATCDWTDLAGSACAGEANTTTAPGALFVDASAGDWRLRPGAPAVDSGRPSGLGLGESALDRAGAERIVDGDLNCEARTDRGAFELPDQSTADCQPANPGGSDPGLPSTPNPNPPPPAPSGPDVTRPIIGAAKAFPAVFAPREAARASARGRAPGGTTFRFTLSEPARVTIVLERALPGRRAGRRCIKPSQANRRRAKCTRWVKVTSLRVDGKRGGNALAFSGRVGRRALGAGRFRARFGARDAAGNLARERIVGLRVLRG